jgi:thioester reductase-like protein
LDLPVDNVDLVVHVAASLKFADEDAGEVRAVNVGGTRAVITLAEAFNSRLMYISTAYVAGRQEGVVKESDPLPDLNDTNGFNNVYEFSKACAERLVAGAAVETQIVRPGIVIGHTNTGAATGLTGYYAVLRAAARLRQAYKGRLDKAQVRVLAEPHHRVALIPVDLVARAAVCIALSDAIGRTFHLTNTTPPTLETAFRSSFRVLGLPDPIFVTDAGDLTPLDRRLRNSFYDAYIASAKSFDTTNVASVCGAQALAYPMSDAEFRKHVQWFLAHTEAFQSAVGLT